MAAVKLVVNILPGYAFLVHKNTYKVKEVSCFPDNFILAFCLTDFFCFFLYLFANSLVIEGCRVATRTRICKAF